MHMCRCLILHYMLYAGLVGRGSEQLLDVMASKHISALCAAAYIDSLSIGDATGDTFHLLTKNAFD